LLYVKVHHYKALEEFASTQSCGWEALQF